MEEKATFQKDWPIQRRRIEALRLKALDVYLTDQDFYGDARRCDSDRGPDIAQLAGALVLGAEGNDLDRLLTSIQNLDETMRVIDSFTTPTTPESQVHYLLLVVRDIIDCLEILLEPWLPSGKPPSQSTWLG